MGYALEAILLVFDGAEELSSSFGLAMAVHAPHIPRELHFRKPFLRK
jgi:hypothetical protein